MSVDQRSIYRWFKALFIEYDRKLPKKDFKLIAKWLYHNFPNTEAATIFTINC